VGPRDGLDRCGKSRPHQDSIPGPSRLQSVAIPTELPGPLNYESTIIKSTGHVFYEQGALPQDKAVRGNIVNVRQSGRELSRT
jgi:hypothetical protein